MKFKLILVLSMIVALNVKAQQDSLKKTTITLAAIYSSNISYYGQVTNEKLPYILANATVRFPIGIYISAGSYKLFNYGSGLSESDLGIGYDHDFSNQFNMGISYTRSFFPANSPLLQAANENNLNLAANYSWKWFKSTLTTDYAFGTQNDIFFSLNNSKEISLGTLFSEENLIFIEPAIELTAGTQRFYETYVIEKGKRDQANGKGRGLQLPQNSNSTVTTAYNNINLMSYNFKLPLSLSRKSYIAEISYQLSILGPKAQTEVKHQQSFLGLAFYYQF
jgi:hypothetical protein